MGTRTQQKRCPASWGQREGTDENIGERVGHRCVCVCACVYVVCMCMCVCMCVCVCVWKYEVMEGECEEELL